MQINRRITNGLAWAGLIVVVAVPVADAVSGQFMHADPQIAVANVAEIPVKVAVEIAPVPAPLSARPHAAVIETAAVAPAKPVALAVVKPVAVSQPVVAKPVGGNNPVDTYLSSGKQLPSYLTDSGAAPEQAVAAPTPIIPVPAVAKPSVAPVETAAAPSQSIVPAAPVAPAVGVDPIEVATLTPAHVAPVPMPLSMRPLPVTRPLAGTRPNEDILLPPEVLASNDARAIVVDDLQDWESGPLSEFLAERQGQQASSATMSSDGGFEDGYYDDRRSGDIYLGPVPSDFFFPFIN